MDIPWRVHSSIRIMRLLTRIFLFTSIIVFGSGFEPENQFRYMLIVFEGSDWCPRCRRLEQSVLSDTLFLHQLDRNSIRIEKIDFPQREKISAGTKQYNTSIAEKYAFDGSFPTLILTRTDTLFYRKINYSYESSAEILAQINSAKSDLQ